MRPDGSGGPILTFRGDSDAHIVRGLIAILFALYSDKAARDILAIDPSALFERLDLREHLTPQRSNGLKSVVARIRAEAETAARRSSRLFSTTNLNPGTETQHLRAFSNVTKVQPSKLA